MHLSASSRRRRVWDSGAACRWVIATRWTNMPPDLPTKTPPSVLRFPLTFVNKFPLCRIDKAGRASRTLCCACGCRELSFRIHDCGSWVLEWIDMSTVC